MEEQIKGQMNIEDFIPLPQCLIDQLEPELKKVGRTFAEEYKHGIDHLGLGYLGTVDKNYAEVIRGEKIKNFHDLRHYVGTAILLESWVYLRMESGRKKHSTWRICQVLEYLEDGVEVVDYENNDQVVATFDRVKCRDSYVRNVPAFYLDEVYCDGGADFRDYGYPKSHAVYQLKKGD